MATVYALAAQFSVGVWTDITVDLVDTPIAITRGFQSNAPDDLVSAPPVLSFALNNAAQNSGGLVGYYSPDSSHLRAGWGLGTPIRFQVTANGTTRTRFIGWLDVITPEAGLFGDQTVACVAVGWLSHAATTLVTGLALQTLQRSDQLLTTVVPIVPFAPAATAFATGADVFPAALDNLDPDSSTVLDAIDSVARSGFDRVYERADGTLVFESRAFRQTSTASVVTLTDAAPDAAHPSLALTGLPAERRRDAIRNRFQVTVHPRRVDVAPVVLYTLQTSGAAPQILPASGTVVIRGSYTDPSQLAQRVGGYNMLISDGAGGSIVGTSGSLPAGDFAFGSGIGLRDLTAAVTVTVSYEAGQAIFTCVNTGLVGAYVTLLQCRGQGVYDFQPATATQSDTASQALCGQVTVTLDCPYQVDPSFAQAAALYALNLYAPSMTQLQQGVSCDVFAGDELSMDVLLGLEISSPISITETVTGLAGGAYWINAVSETYDERCNATFVLALTPRDPNTYFTVDVSTLDGPDVLAAI